MSYIKDVCALTQHLELTLQETCKEETIEAIIQKNLEDRVNAEITLRGAIQTKMKEKLDSDFAQRCLKDAPQEDKEQLHYTYCISKPITMASEIISKKWEEKESSLADPQKKTNAITRIFQYIQKK